MRRSAISCLYPSIFASSHTNATHFSPHSVPGIGGNNARLSNKVKGNVSPGGYPLVFAGIDDSGRERDATLLVVVP
ncbi:MAG TPA: hypothetical protein VEZ90_03670 [Blastocatellia bacterium]|nr:hypothetical protein [Blastocatellia bacterium]